MFLKKIGLIGLISIIFLTSSVLAREFTAAEKELINNIRLIKFTVKETEISTAIMKTLSGTIKDKLTLIGFKVIAEDNNNFDATMFSECESKDIPNLRAFPMGFVGTARSCYIRMEHPIIGELFSIRIHGDDQVGDTVPGSLLIPFQRDPTFRNFDQVVIKNLGLSQESLMAHLIEALKDEDPIVRSITADGLGNLKDIRAVDPLIDTLKDANSGVRWHASLALRSIQVSKTSMDEDFFGEDSLKWREWWVKYKSKKN